LLASSIINAEKPSLYFEKITVQNGLSNNKVTCMVQDKRGFIWIGTNDGLNRFDGSNFLIFRNRPADNTSISGNIITDLLEDKNEILWIATADGGMTKYDYRLPPAQQFKQFKHLASDDSSIPINIITSLLEDQYGYLWLATSGKYVLRFDKKTERFDEPVRKGPKNMLDLCLDENGIIWAGRQGGGILKINTRTLESVMDDRYNNLYAKLPHAAVSSLFIDKDKNIWFGSWDKLLFRVDAKTKHEQAFGNDPGIGKFTNDEIQAFAQDRHGRIWMGGKYFGLTLFDPVANQFHNYRNEMALDGSLADNSINSLFIDRNGLVWIGTNKGISIYNPEQQPFEQTFLSKNNKELVIYDFFTDDKSNLWIGTSDGLYVNENGKNNFIHRPLEYRGNKLTVSKFFKDVDGSLYLGTNFSLFKYDISKNQLSLLPNTEKDPVMYNIIESRIVSMIRDTIEAHPVLIALPYGHYLAYYDFAHKKWISRMDSSKNILNAFNLQDNLLRKLYRASSGKLWFATGRLGLGEWSKQQLPYLRYFTNDPGSSGSLTNNDVFDIKEDQSGNLWISTHGGGLNYFNTTTNKAVHINITDNLLEGIETDDYGRVWMVCNGNLHRYDPRLKTYSSFFLPDLEKSGGISRYIYKDPEGNMYVTGKNYFVRFHPSVIRSTSTSLNVFFTDFRIFNSSYSHLLFKKNIELNYNQNYFTVEFAAPEYLTGKPEYAYMLEGLDNDWIELGRRNFANFSNLSGGTYTFKVRVTDKKGVWPTNYATLHITIIPPFWLRWWFFALAGLFVAGLIYAFYRYRINELLRRQAIRDKIAQDLHDSVGSTLSSVSVYSQVANIQQANGNFAELKNVLQKIASTSSEMIAEMNDIVWALNPHNDSMEKILQRMESFAKPLLQTQNINFSFEYEKTVLKLNLSMEQRKNFYLIFKEAINNVLKYSAARNLYVSINVHYRKVVFTLADDGVGFDATEMRDNAERSLSGNGLRNMKRRANEMRGTCIIESKKGKGTTIKLQFAIT
jgi:ligand-binding sensor domain-containing protein/two-component sensor histidine kinase